MLCAGIDIGSTITKVVVKNEAHIRATVIQPTGAEHRRLAHNVMKAALEEAGTEFGRIDYIVATGYGRINVPFADRQVTEITCHMRGVNFLFPGARTIIDIGGQDLKGIKVVDGKLRDFVMNDKCAAGTGRFLEVIAEVLGVALEDIGDLSLKSESPSDISNLCTVFAEQEALLRLSEGTPIADILAGIHKANATRINAMVSKLKIERDVVLTGGGAKNVGIVKALEDKIGLPLVVPPEPLITGALGAAIIAAESCHKAGTEELAARKRERRLGAVTFFGSEEAGK
jgi:(R)-2-hydroxyacyl-CoA dehydratese activating ATPase